VIEAIEIGKTHLMCVNEVLGYNENRHSYPIPFRSVYEIYTTIVYDIVKVGVTHNLPHQWFTPEIVFFCYKHVQV
jgi:hypothetical protein